MNFERVGEINSLFQSTSYKYSTGWYKLKIYIDHKLKQTSISFKSRVDKPNNNFTQEQIDWVYRCLDLLPPFSMVVDNHWREILINEVIDDYYIELFLNELSLYPIKDMRDIYEAFDAVVFCAKVIVEDNKLVLQIENLKKRKRCIKRNLFDDKNKKIKI